ncbi:phosphate acyltransferase PlsX [Salinicola rhizosphaerae]|uniref:Phosphate acyltransferase n=1 Tax=Salinicola rhizosphaerae TaxID=1443141 RepID=A0ABQ3DNT7_9GAMM|nr:phosphate acyltransferase PlsX [Salinicola rhizosphaerae]GHB08130.1 phosphate acyltransferase [Salinicola rhizosphaerae]
MRIAIDAMGGDLGPRATIGGLCLALARHPQLHLLVFGPRDDIQSVVAEQASAHGLKDVFGRLELIDAPRSVLQSASPMKVLDDPDGTSLLAMLAAVRDGHAEAGVTCGNTGALMALARRELGTVPGISRPAISTAVPTRDGGRCYLLDLGASVEAHARHLVDFVDMGALMAKVVDGAERPRVALLNMGVEAGKGVVRVREADESLRSRESLEFDYVGYLEGDAIFSGRADVVVCDGFVGNAVLKASEGVAQMLLERLQEMFESHWSTRLVSALARPALMRFKAQLDPVRHNGASLLGLNRIVVKSHGNASERAFAFAIERAVREVEVGLPDHLRAAWLQNAVEPAISSAGSNGRVDSGSRDVTGTDDSSLQG